MRCYSVLIGRWRFWRHKVVRLANPMSIGHVFGEYGGREENCAPVAGTAARAERTL